jgi:hypothetical protein
LAPLGELEEGHLPFRGLAAAQSMVLKRAFCSSSSEA